MRARLIHYILFFMLVSIIFNSCREDDDGSQRDIILEGETIELIFYQNDEESRTEFETGLKWAFSLLGARLEKEFWAQATTWQSPTKLQVNINQLGFNRNAQEQLEKLIGLFKSSEEYLINGGIDAGRFVVCILNNSNHYYKIVGMPTTLDRYLSNTSFLQKRAAIIESAVAIKERLIQLPSEGSAVSGLHYFAEELLGSILDSSYRVAENEVMDIMDNGQLRFGVYDTLGQLIVGSNPDISIAGKPIKCLWCHETVVQPGFSALTSVPGYYSPQEFDSIVGENNSTLNAYRTSLNSDSDIENSRNHEKVELLYIRFMEPSYKRLAAEWGISITEVETKLTGLSTHTNHEFPFLGQLFDRVEVEQFSPYATLPSTSSARETNDNEPNLLP